MHNVGKNPQNFASLARALFYRIMVFIYGSSKSLVMPMSTGKGQDYIL